MKNRKRVFIRPGDIKKIAALTSETNVTSYGVMVCVGMISVSALLCYIYRLNQLCSALVFATGAFCIPLVLFYHFYQKRENIRFSQVDVYIHQMAYSFMRNPKILTALKDTMEIADGHLKQVILKSVVYLESEDKALVYEESLKIIEEQYPCERVRTLHKFLISIEVRGGEYRQSLAILLDDFDRWVRRMYKHQEDIRHVRINSNIGVILSCILASMSIIMTSMINVSGELSLNITDNLIYQIETCGFLVISICYFTYIQIHYSRDWLSGVRDEASVIRDYNYVFLRKTSVITTNKLLCTAVILAAGSFLGNDVNYLFLPVSFVIVSAVYICPVLMKSKAMGRLKEDVYNGFSEWLREVAINLSHEPLQVAIQESYGSCPAVMKPSLGRFIYELDENPCDVAPYYRFLSEFNILDISSTIKTLYTITENQSDHIDDVINSIISRKNELADKHESLKNRDDISVLQFAEYIPLLFVSVKIGIDMMLVISSYL